MATTSKAAGKDSAATKSVYSAKEMKSLGVLPCDPCNVMPGFIPSTHKFEGKTLHVFECPKCGKCLGDFLEPNDEDEGVKHWNEEQKNRRSERLDPFDQDWHEKQVAPALIALGKDMESSGRQLGSSRVRSKAQLDHELTSLDKMASEIAATVTKLRAEFAKRHKPAKT